MPTPSELQNERPRRSVFGNFNPAPVAAFRESTASIEQRPAAGSGDPAHLQASIDAAMARTFLYRFLAKAFEDPEPEGWAWLTAGDITSALRSAVMTLSQNSKSPLAQLNEEFARHLTPDAFDDFAATHLTCFGHTVRGDCPMNEIEYGDIKADPLFQPHRLSDLGAN
jgi:hypothetical protein